LKVFPPDTPTFLPRAPSYSDANKKMNEAQLEKAKADLNAADKAGDKAQFEKVKDEIKSKLIKN
jgi:hypothetical protein